MAKRNTIGWTVADGDHPTTTLNYRGAEIPVDNKLVPLMNMMWKLYIATLACCQGNPEKEKLRKKISVVADNMYADDRDVGYAYIMFLTIEDMQQFINICWGYGSNSLKKNMFGDKKTWKFEANGYENDLQFDDFVLRGTVRFSQSDISKITKAFQEKCY